MKTLAQLVMTVLGCLAFLVETRAEELRVAFGQGRPPFVYEVDGMWEGFEIDIVREVLAVRGHSIEAKRHFPNTKLARVVKPHPTPRSMLKIGYPGGCSPPDLIENHLFSAPGYRIRRPAPSDVEKPALGEPVRVRVHRYGLLDDAHHRAPKPLHLFPIERLRRTARRDSRPEQNFVGDPVTHPGHEGLIEEQRFDGSPPAREPFSQLTRGDRGDQGVEPKLTDRGFCFRVPHEPDSAQPSAIVVDHTPCGRNQIELHVSLARLGWLKRLEPTRHSEMKNRVRWTIEDDPRVLPASIRTHNPTPFQLPRQRAWRHSRYHNSVIGRPDFFDSLTGENALRDPAERFNFR